MGASLVVGGIAAGAAVAGTAASIAGGSSGSSQAGQYADQAAGSAAQASAVDTTLAQIAREQWDRYLQVYAPLESQMVAEAQSPGTAASQPGFQTLMGDINRNYGNQAANIRRMMGGRYPSGSGLDVAAQRTNELQRNQTLAKTASDWTQNWNDKMWQRKYAVSGLGKNLPTQAQSGLSSAAQGYGSVAGQYGNLAGMYANQSNQAFSGAGNAMGNLYQAYILSKNLGGGSGGSSTPSAPAYSGWTTPGEDVPSDTWLYE
jgi:hypothetical protein